MRRGTTYPLPPNTGEPQAQPVMDPEMWVQLSVEQHWKTSRLLEEKQHQTNFLLNTVQQLQEEMVRVRKDNEWLLQEQEKILKSLSDKKNQEVEHPSTDRAIHEEEEQQTRHNTTDRAEEAHPSEARTKIIMKQNLAM